MTTLNIAQLKQLISKGQLREQRELLNQRFRFMGNDSPNLIRPQKKEQRLRSETTQQAIWHTLNALDDWWERLELSIQIILLWLDGSRPELREVLGPLAKLRTGRSLLFTFSSSPNDGTKFDAWYTVPDSLYRDGSFHPADNPYEAGYDPLVWSLIGIREDGYKSIYDMGDNIGCRILDAVGDFYEFTSHQTGWKQSTSIYFLTRRH